VPYPFYTAADRRFRYARDEILGPARYHATMDRMIRAAGVDIPAVARALWMTPEHLRHLHHAGHVVGLHSHTHPTRLERLTPADQHREYAANHAALTRILGRAPVTMSHPCNSYTADTLTLLRTLGIRLGFRANMAPVASATELELPREDHANVLATMRTAA